MHWGVGGSRTVSDAWQSLIVALVIAGAIALLVWPRKQTAGGCGTGCAGCEHHGATEKESLPLVSLDSLITSAITDDPVKQRSESPAEPQQGSNR
jgi:hypothetical protein